MMNKKKSLLDSFAGPALLALIFVWLSTMITTSILTVRELKRHNLNMEKIDIEYKLKSISVSEDFNQAVREIGK